MAFEDTSLMLIGNIYRILIGIEYDTRKYCTS